MKLSICLTSIKTYKRTRIIDFLNFCLRSIIDSKIQKSIHIHHFEIQIKKAEPLIESVFIILWCARDDESEHWEEVVTLFE